MTPTEITAHALELGITPELYLELWACNCEEGFCCDAEDCERPRCTLPSPDSDDPRACLWEPFYMRALGWPNLGNYDDFYECLVACGDMMLSSHRGPTSTAALRAAWLAKGASK